MSKLDNHFSVVEVQAAEHNSLEAKLSAYGKQQIKDLMLEIIGSVTEVEDIPNQHVPAEYIPDANLLRQKVNEL